MLGAHVARELLGAGLLDEVRVHLVPLLMGKGTARRRRAIANLLATAVAGWRTSTG